MKRAHQESPITQIENGNRKMTEGGGAVLLVVQLEDLQSLFWFQAVQSLAVNISLGKMYIDTGIRGIFPMDYKRVPKPFARVTLLRDGTELKVTSILSHEMFSHDQSKPATI